MSVKSKNGWLNAKIDDDSVISAFSHCKTTEMTE